MILISWLPQRRKYCRWAERALASLLLVTLFSQICLAQNLGRGVDDGISIWRVVAALLVCMGVAVGAAFLLRRGMPMGRMLQYSKKKTSRLQVIETLRIRPQTDLCIFACDGEEFLMVLSPQSASLLRPVLRTAPKPSLPDTGP
jgi:flagellar protein FliO/FliZ